MKFNFGELFVGRPLGAEVEMQLMLQPAEHAAAEAIVAGRYPSHLGAAQEREKPSLADAPWDLESRLLDWE